MKANLAKAALYGAMIAFTAHIGEAIPFPYHEGIAALPIAVQALLFWGAGFLIFFVCVTAKQAYDAKGR